LLLRLFEKRFRAHERLLFGGRRLAA
jgi:hypothetical protein